MIEIRRLETTHPDFTSLFTRLDRLLRELNGDANEFYAGHNKVESLTNAVVVYADGEPVGCGAFKPVGEGTVEVKRMFTLPEHRGAGLASRVLGELEAWAKELRHSRAILETSRRLERAVRLYERSGYRRIPNYGPYVGVEDSVCFEKAL